MKRLPDWHSRFCELIETMRREPFEWGTNDCGASFAGRAIEALTGVNPWQESIGAYKSVSGALRHMRSHDAKNLAEVVDKKLTRSPVAFANIGDIAAIPDDSAFAYSLGIVNGERVFVRRPDGMGTVDLLQAEFIYKI